MTDDNTEAYARETDPGTSHEAAESVRTTKLETIVLTAIRSCGDRGATAYELEKTTRLPNQTLTPRFAPLCRKSKIHDSGEKRVGGSGRRQIVWKYSVPFDDGEAYNSWKEKFPARYPANDSGRIGVNEKR